MMTKTYQTSQEISQEIPQQGKAKKTHAVKGYSEKTHSGKGHSGKGRGGRRVGAGRPAGQGKYKEATKPVRVPMSKIDAVYALITPHEQKNTHDQDAPKASAFIINKKANDKNGSDITALRFDNTIRFDGVLNADLSHQMALPLYESRVSAGFPSPADDYMEGTLDLNQHLIRHPSATFFVRASGQSMIKAGIHDGDILVVDRSLQAKSGKIVIAVIDGQLTVKRLEKQGDAVYLCPENDDYEPIKIDEGNDLIIWGIVTNVIHNLS